jgi:hypothetical protein
MFSVGRYDSPTGRMGVRRPWIRKDENLRNFILGSPRLSLVIGLGETGKVLSPRVGYRCLVRTPGMLDGQHVCSSLLPS